MKIRIHDVEVAAVMTELAEDFWPGVALVSAEEELTQVDVLPRWENEDREEREGRWMAEIDAMLAGLGFEGA